MNANQFKWMAAATNRITKKKKKKCDRISEIKVKNINTYTNTIKLVRNEHNVSEIKHKKKLNIL